MSLNLSFILVLFTLKLNKELSFIFIFFNLFLFRRIFKT
jgi:hypothetical protein